MSSTIDYYNHHAAEYFNDTVDVDFDALRRKFVTLLPKDAKIIDVGCGSGRDVKAFCDMGFDAIGLDASEELAAQAENRLGIQVIVCDMSKWKAEEPFDGIWCCASLLHLLEDEAASFFNNLKNNLKRGGILFLSVKEGIETGLDKKDRYMRNYTEEELQRRLETAGLKIIEIESSEDKLNRDGFRWLNAFAKKE